ncbi:MAG: amidohydrolase family protein [Burkholderiales bacterium]
MTDPEGARLPIKLDSTSNGEFVPVSLSRANRHANRLARAQAGEHAKRLGLARRNFLVSACSVQPNSNVYAELGSTWRFLMRDPEAAAHALGKLIRYCGENNVLWGTDSIWYGSPQDQIQAFRTFQISPELRAKHGYPETTPALRAKIFGLNAARVYGLSAEEVKKYTQRDRIASERLAYGEHPDPHYLTYGPKTRREFLNLLGWNGGAHA